MRNSQRGMEVALPCKSRPSSSFVRLGSAASNSPRRTHVSEDVLRRLVAAPPRQAPDDSLVPRVVSTAMQTTVCMSDVTLLEMLVGHTNTVGVVTASHARDLMKMQLFFAHALANLEDEESRGRLVLEAMNDSHLLHFTEFRKLLVCSSNHRLHVTLPTVNVVSKTNNTSYKSAARLSPSQTNEATSPMTPGRSGISREPSFDSSTFEDALMMNHSRSGAHSPAPSSRFSPLPSDDVNRLRNKIHMLENRVRTVAKTMDTQNLVTSRSINVFGTAKSNRDQQLALSREKQLERVQPEESAKRCRLLNEEMQSWRIVELSWEVVTLQLQLRNATRVMIHAPFTSYRPKIPIQHSLAGEEYLRRWILVETLQHYEDCLCMLQQHENTTRNAIEDQYEAEIQGLFSRVFLPHFVSRCAILEKEMATQVAQSREQIKRADSLYAMLQLRVIVDEEATLRDMLCKTSADEYQGLVLLHDELGQVRSVHALAKRLEGELTRQKQRHRDETAFLMTQLPRHGVIHPSLSAVAQFQLMHAEEDDKKKLTQAVSMTSSLTPTRPPSARVGPSAGSGSGRASCTTSPLLAKQASSTGYWAGF